MQILKMDDGKTKLVTSDNGMRHEHFECICDSEEHSMRVTYFVDEWNGIEEDEIYFSLYLADRGFFYRLWHGIMFIFGHKCRYGDFQCITLQRADAERLRDLMTHYIDSGLVEVNNERKVKIVEKGDGYVITDGGVKVWLLAD
jgi:hypothetical protein